MKKSSILSLILAILTLSVYSQEKPAVNSFVKNQKGFGVVDKDSTFSLKFLFQVLTATTQTRCAKQDN